MRAYRYNPVPWQYWLPGVAGSVGSLVLSLLLVGWWKPQGTTRWVVIGLVCGAGYLCLKNIGEAVFLLLRSRRGGVWTDEEGFVVSNWMGRKERVTWAQVVSVAHTSGRVQIVWQSPRHWRPKTLDVGTRELEEAFDLIQDVAERTGKQVASPAPPAGLIPLGEIDTGRKPEEEKE